MNEEEFQVSVIIPVYNAERFIERAIKSSLSQAEVAEVLVVDDAYTDQAFEIVKRMAKDEPRIKLFTHPGHVNKGAGASRNLALKKVTQPYIAFLDADDFFLENRFKKTRQTFAERPEVSIVYEPVGAIFENEQSRKKFAQLKSISIDETDLHLSYPKVPSEGRDFFLGLLDGSTNMPCTDGLTFKASLIEKSGTFDPTLRLHQDKEFYIRLAYHGYMSSTGDHDTPVSKRYQHDENRIFKKNYKSSYLVYKNLYERWKNVEGIPSQTINNLRERQIRDLIYHYFHEYPLWAYRISRLVNWFLRIT